jgi:phosphatidylinositol alpha-1,6-mannosyltransferase
VKHKGVEWFIRSVVPLLPKNILFVAAGAIIKKNTPGDVDIFGACQETIRELHLENRVKLFADLSWEKMKLLYRTVDLVVSPNIEVPGTMEGFGISVLEAAICGRPVIASDLQGLKDAIVHNENGLLVEPGNKEAFVTAILSLITDENKRRSLGERAVHYTEAHYHWSIIARLYIEALESFIKKTH